MRKLIALVCLLFAAKLVFAAEVGLDEAKSFAKGWRGKNVSAARTHKSAAGESRFHVVSFEGGGWAAVGVDDEESPVIAFSDNGEELVEDEKNPVWFLVKRDAEWRAKGREISHKEHKGRRGKHKGWERKKVEGGRRKVEGDGEGVGRGVKTATATVKTSVGDSGLSEICVAPLVKSTWDQESVFGGYCYNYYTPNNYPSGCVATMMAQMMRYFEWPKTSVKAKTFPCYVGETIPDEILASDIVNKTMKGGVYDWSKMTLNPDVSTPDENRQEIGKLCYDVGVSVSMMWSKGESGAFTSLVREALVDTFGYSDAHLVIYDYPTKEYPDPVHPYDFKELKLIVISNCEAGLPVGYGISGSSGGHAVVIDGYGYSGEEFYMHINPGWSGTANAWYNPPNLAMGGYSFNTSDELVYNVFTEGTGALVTGKVVDEKGNPVEGATVSGYLTYYNNSRKNLASVKTDAKGKYHLKTGLKEIASTLYVTVEKSGHYSQTQEAALLASQTMLGDREYPFMGIYLYDYSLGNKIDFDFTLPSKPTPKVLFR